MITKVSIQHDPKRTLPWIVRYFGEPDWNTGKQRRYSRSFRYSREARAFQCEKQTELSRGNGQETSRNVTLIELVTEFRSARLPGLSFETVRGYENTLTQLLDHFGKGRPLTNIPQRRAEAFIASRIRMDGRAGGLSRSSIARHIIHARALFGAAVEWKFIEENPFVCTVRRGRSPLRVNAVARSWQHLTPQQFATFMMIVDCPKHRAAFWLMYGCGLRPGEIYNLTIDRIDLEKRRVLISSRPATDAHPPFAVKAEGQASTAKDRTVPIPEPAMGDISKACQTAFRSGGFVVLSPERFVVVRRNWELCRAGKGWAGRKTWRPWQNRDMMNNLLRDTKSYLPKAGLEFTVPFALSTFRKSFAQNHADAGTPPRTLAKLLGHSDTRVTMMYYNRSTDANEAAARAVMDRVLSVSVQPADANAARKTSEN